MMVRPPLWVLAFVAGLAFAGMLNTASDLADDGRPTRFAVVALAWVISTALFAQEWARISDAIKQAYEEANKRMQEQEDRNNGMQRKRKRQRQRQQRG